MAVRKATLIIFIAKIVALNCIINPNGPTVVSDYKNCISDIMEKNFKGTGVLIFTNFNNASTSVSNIKAGLLTKIHKKVKYLVEVKGPQVEVDICNKYDDKLGVLHKDTFEARPLGSYFIIIVDALEDFPYLLSRLIRSRSWNPSAKFIILLFNFGVDKKNIQHVEDIISCVFKYNVMNVIVLVPQSNNIRNAILYSWRPYDPPKYCGYSNETAKGRLVVENTCEKGLLKHNRGVFEDKIPADLNGCVLNIIALERQPFVSNDGDDPNIEKILIDELVGRYKLRTNYDVINSYRGEREGDGQWNGALKELTLKSGQLLLGGIFPDFDVHEDFESSLSYLADSYAWVVPRSYQSPPWIALAIIFQKFVWYSVIAAFSICAIFWRILGQLSKDGPRNLSLSHCYLNAWICSLGFCAYLRPTSSSLRLFFVFFNIYCILVFTGYQTKLIDVLKNPTFEYQIQTIEELVDSGLKIGGFEELHDLFWNSTHEIDDYIFNNWIHVNDISDAMLDVAVHRNFSLLCSRLELAHVSAVITELSDSYGNFRYYAFETNMFSVPIEMLSLRGFGLMGKISQTLGLFQQAGINMAVRNSFQTYNARRRAKLLRSLLQEKSDINALSLQHLQGGFLVLAFGYISGTLVLGLEIIMKTEFVKSKFYIS